MPDHKIEIKLTQTFDETSATATQQKVQTSAEKSAAAVTAVVEQESKRRVATAQEEAAAITATEETEAQKRIAIAQEEASAKAQALAQSPATQTAEQPDTLPSGNDGLKFRLRFLENLQDAMDSYQEKSRSWVASIDEVRAALEAPAEGVSASKEALAEFDAGIEELATHQVELHEEMQRIISDAQALAEDMAKGKVSMEDAAHAAEDLQKRNKAVSQGMKEMSQDAKRLKEDMQAAMEETQKGTDNSGKGVSGLGKVLNTMGKSGKAAAAGMVKGFTMATRAARTLRRAVSQVTIALAIINQAWEFLIKLWDWMHGKNEEATRAAEEHAEAMKELKETAEETMRSLAQAERRQKALDFYKHQETALKRVNEELERGLKLKNRDIEVELRRKKLAMDREEWELEEQLADIDAKVEDGLLEEQQAVSLRADIEKRRAELEYERQQAEQQARRERLTYEQERVRTGLVDAEKTLGLAQSFENYGITPYAPEEMKILRELNQKNQLRGKQKVNYDNNIKQTRTLMEHYGMGDVFDAYYRGDINLKDEMKKLEESVLRQHEQLQERLQTIGNDLETLTMDETEATDAYQRQQKSLMRKAKRQKDKAQLDANRETLKEESDEIASETDAEARKAREQSSALRQRNKALIDQRLSQQKNEAGLQNLYETVEQLGDADFLRRLIAELKAGGNQGYLKRKDAQVYDASHLRDAVKLKGEDRKWWSERFEGLQQSQQMAQQGKQLDEAADALKKAAAGHIATMGEVSQEARRLAEAYAEQLEEVWRLRDTFAETFEQIKTLKTQARNRMR